MKALPQFPDFKPIEMIDRDFLHEKFSSYQPETSELNFTNLFMWRSYYGFEWSTYKDWVLILTTSEKEKWGFFPPVGPPDRSDVTYRILEWLRDEKKEKNPRIRRADGRLVSEVERDSRLTVCETRDHFDYIYNSSDLIQLVGRKYHAKRNHINKFRRLYTFEYQPLSVKMIPSCIRLFQKWCEHRNCLDDFDLRAECESVHLVFFNYNDLHVKGGIIKIDGHVMAFTVGEQITNEMAVIHIEKADPEIPQLYTVINQQFCEHTWQDVRFINREQDLGKPGLQKAKGSYYPHHFVKKYEIKLG